MPGISGFGTCEKIREVSNVPVLFLTARSDESDKLLGLTAGGDDYLIKPFSYAELLARVKALLRRYMVYDRAAENETAERRKDLERKRYSGSVCIRRHAGLEEWQGDITVNKRISDFTFADEKREAHLFPGGNLRECMAGAFFL